jgi:3',5'-cyclic AMP phosphodiesterase CpdA
MIYDNDRPLFSFAIITDSHITDEEGLAIDGSHQTGKNVAGVYGALIERINTMEPAFVVNLGDVHTRAQPLPIMGRLHWLFIRRPKSSPCPTTWCPAITM